MERFLRRVFGEDWGVRSLDGLSAPASPENRSAMARFTLYMAGGFVAMGTVMLALMVASGQEVEELRFSRAVGSSVLSLLVTALLWFIYQRLSIGWLHLQPIISTAILVGVGIPLGRSLEPPVVLGVVIIAVIYAVTFTPRAVLVHSVHTAIGFAVVLQETHVAVPFIRWIGTIGGAVIIALAVARLVERNRDLVLAEHNANLALEAARTQLADLNHTLEERVEEQVADLERLGELQRFLPAPLVDAVLTDAQELLEPHRGEIAVLFCDLRGFTPFAADVAPEEVHDLLGGYFDLLGTHAQRAEATVGAFTGDGMMAFFNDPLPCPDPVAKAVAMAVGLQEPIAALLGHWQRVGHDLGFGVGISFGYANIGMIGFEGRRDYTALGPVVNLAARLCAEASSGGILLDPRASVALDGTVELGAPQSLRLKGFERPVDAIPVIVPA